MKIAFFGTPEFATKSLEALHQDDDISVELVISQADKKVGRKLRLTPPPVKATAERLGLKVSQPKNREELLQTLKDLDVDFFVVIAYGMILSEEILNIPKIAPINIHASLLPKYRGASPLQQTLLNGDTEAGISIMKMTKGMDEGPVFQMERIQISREDNLETLHDKLAKLGADLIAASLKNIKNQDLIAKDQGEEELSYCKKIQKEDGNINWHQNTSTILNQIRAYTPWPSAYTKLHDKTLKIIKAEDGEENIEAGLFHIEEESLKIGTSDGSISIKILQLEGKKSSKVKDFINGNKKLFLKY
jgi:methionyl-tRNA formyltransferase